MAVWWWYGENWVDGAGMGVKGPGLAALKHVSAGPHARIYIPVPSPSSHLGHGAAQAAHRFEHQGHQLGPGGVHGDAAVNGLLKHARGRMPHG